MRVVCRKPTFCIKLILRQVTQSKTIYFNQNHNLSSVMCNGAVKTDVLREHAIDKAILLKVAKSLGLNIARGPCVLGHMVRASF